MKKIHFDRPCEACGELFRPHNAEQRFCSMACRPKSSGRPRELEDRQCETCGKVFRPADRYRRFCSMACRPGAPVTRPDIICPTCGKAFRKRYASAKFCSMKCRPRLAKDSKGRYANVTRTCEKCGRLYHPWKPNKPSRFCSRACAPRGRQPTRPDVACKQCGVLFRPTSLKRVFCSRQCYRASSPRVLTPQGYVLIWAPEHSTRESGQALEHRVVMEKKLGRQLERHETVHHIDGNRANNNPENLQLRQGKHGKGVRHRCADCGSHNIVTEAL